MPEAVSPSREVVAMGAANGETALYRRELM
jgi:hypothetical protein